MVMGRRALRRKRKGRKIKSGFGPKDGATGPQLNLGLSVVKKNEVRTAFFNKRTSNRKVFIAGPSNHKEIRVYLFGLNFLSSSKIFVEGEDDPPEIS